MLAEAAIVVPERISDSPGFVTAGEGALPNTRSTDPTTKKKEERNFQGGKDWRVVAYTSICKCNGKYSARRQFDQIVFHGKCTGR